MPVFSLLYPLCRNAGVFQIGGKFFCIRFLVQADKQLRFLRLFAQGFRQSRFAVRAEGELAAALEKSRKTDSSTEEMIEPELSGKPDETPGDGVPEGGDRLTEKWTPHTGASFQ